MRSAVIELDHTKTCRSTLFNCTNSSWLLILQVRHEQFLRPSTARTVPITLRRSRSATLVEIKKNQCAKNHAAWYTDSSCSISVSNDFATQKKYHLALFTFKGVSSTKSTACLFFEEIICTAAMLARSAMTAFICSSDCNLKTLSVTRTMSEPSSSAVTLPMTRCTLPSHMLKRIACCNWQKASTRKCLGNCASTATTFSYCSMMTLSSPVPVSTILASPSSARTNTVT